MPSRLAEKRIMGNIMQEHIFDIWSGKILTKFRKDLLNGKRNSDPCIM